MKKINFISLLFLVFVFIVGCTVNDIPLDVNDDVTLKSGEKHSVPFKSTFELWSDGATSGPPIINLIVYGSGNATHMGKTDLVVTETITTQEPPSPWLAEASVVATAANGDELHFDYTSVINPSDFPNLDVFGICIITGGTGRFDGASGTLTYKGEFNADTNIGIATFNGNILY